MSEKIRGSYSKLLFDLAELYETQCHRANTTLPLWADFYFVPVLGLQYHLLGVFGELTYLLSHLFPRGM